MSKTRKTAHLTLVYILLTAGAVMMLMPFYYMLSTSVKAPE